jgi:hypothetical protein
VRKKSKKIERGTILEGDSRIFAANETSRMLGRSDKKTR